MDLENKARRIAKIIADTDSDDRGNLLVLIGNDLRWNAQGFTGNLLRSAGMEYGLNPKQPGHPNYK